VPGSVYPVAVNSRAAIGGAYEEADFEAGLRKELNAAIGANAAIEVPSNFFLFFGSQVMERCKAR
jgi:hypothetical protein